jgi:rhodanese-related sulfurtransferase
MNTVPAISISPIDLQQQLGAFPRPTLVDVRRRPAFDADPNVIPGAIRRDPESVADWLADLEPWRAVVVYCVHGHNVSQNTAIFLRQAGLPAGHLDGGLEAWRTHGGAVATYAGPTRWVTRARPKIDRIACPWLVRRFVDPDAEFLYVPVSEVKRAAQEKTATPYDVADVEFTHVGERCSFDAFVDKFHLRDPALDKLATIVRGADTSRLDLAPQAPGLLAISQGLSMNFPDDHQMLEHGMVVYDALYAWCRQ